MKVQITVEATQLRKEDAIEVLPSLSPDTYVIPSREDLRDSKTPYAKRDHTGGKNPKYKPLKLFDCLFIIVRGKKTRFVPGDYLVRFWNMESLVPEDVFRELLDDPVPPKKKAPAKKK